MVHFSQYLYNQLGGVGNKYRGILKKIPLVFSLVREIPPRNFLVRVALETKKKSSVEMPGLPEALNYLQNYYGILNTCAPDFVLFGCENGEVEARAVLRCVLKSVDL